MCNNLFSLGPLTVHGYGLMIGIGVVAALFLAWHRADRRGIPQERVTSLVVAVLIFGFLGTKLLYVLTRWREFLTAPLTVLGSEGFVVYGGILAGFLTCWLFCRRRGERFLVWMDLLFPSVALAQGFGRLGCFLAGCCYGKTTSSCLGVVFPSGSSAPAGVALWPTQLFSAAGDFLLAAVLLLYDLRKHPDGGVGILYLLLYGVGRFLLEFLRDDPRGSVGVLSTSQFLSLFAVAGAAALWLILRKRSVNGHES